MKTLRIIVGIAFVNVLLFSVGISVAIQREAVMSPTPIESASMTPVPTSTQAAPLTTAVPVATSARTPTPVPTKTPAQTGCIITVDGVRYDVTVFRKQHSGGNIFTCGADMSATFHGEHGQRELQRMQPYRLP